MEKFIEITVGMIIGVIIASLQSSENVPKNIKKTVLTVLSLVSVLLTLLIMYFVAFILFNNTNFSKDGELESFVFITAVGLFMIFITTVNIKNTAKLYKMEKIQKK